MALIHHVAGGASAGPGWSPDPTGHVASTPNLEFLYQMNGDYTDQAGNYADLTPSKTNTTAATVNADGTIDEYFLHIAPGNQQYRVLTAAIPNQGTGSAHLTVACLMRRNTGGSQYMLTYYDNTAGVNWSLGTAANKARAVYNGASSNTASDAWADMEASTDWHHLCLVIEDQTTTRDITLYFDGVKQNATATGLGLHGLTDSPYLLVGGFTWAGTTFSVDGNCKSVIGIADALTAGEVLALSNAALAA